MKQNTSGILKHDEETELVSGSQGNTTASNEASARDSDMHFGASSLEVIGMNWRNVLREGNSKRKAHYKDRKNKQT
jgi:hypothetical protein